MKMFHERAFTLVEMAFVLLIIGLLTKTAIGPLTTLQAHGKRERAEQDLHLVREAVFAYLVAYGALPCPSLASSANTPYSMKVTGTSRAVDGQICKVSSGWVPTYELGLAGRVNDRGALLDPWGREYQYAVSLSNDADKGGATLPDWTTPGEAANVGITNLSSDIILCNSSSGANCTGRAIRSDQIAFVVMSAGADNSTRGLQAENQDNDNYFVVTDESVITGAQFDDLLVWGSAADVMYWMLRMGWLP